MGAILAAAVGFVLALGVTWHEWAYHQHHPGRTGVSGVFVALGLAVAAGCLSALLMSWKTWSEEERERQAWSLRMQELQEHRSESDEGEDQLARRKWPNQPRGPTGQAPLPIFEDKARQPTHALASKSIHAAGLARTTWTWQATPAMATPAGELPFYYTNSVEFTMGPFDLTIDFGFKSPEEAKRGSPDFTRLARVSMSPSHAKSMLQLLLNQIQAYENQFGIIPSPHYETGERPDE